MLLIVDKNYDIKIRTAKEAEEPIKCESPFSGGYVLSVKHVLTGESGKSILLRGTIGVGMAWGNSDGILERMHEYSAPREIKIESLTSPQFWLFNKSKEEEKKIKETVYKDLLQFKDKIIDGDMDIFIGGCEPRKLNYKIKIRGRIIGECECLY
jgi:hypothetical protein